MSTPTSARARFAVDTMTKGRGQLWSLSACCALTAACSRAPDDLREWRPSDHRHTTEGSSEAAHQAPQVSGSAETSVPGLDEVTIASYRRGCVPCHGELGRGDGPQGVMVKARDLSDPAWQATATDAQIADAIVKGRGRMPAFALPRATVDGLVRLVRLFDRSRSAPEPEPSPSPSPSGAPSSARPRVPGPAPSASAVK